MKFDENLDPLAAEILGGSTLRQALGCDGFLDRISISVTVPPTTAYHGGVVAEVATAALGEQVTGLDELTQQLRGNPSALKLLSSIPRRPFDLKKARRSRVWKRLVRAAVENVTGDADDVMRMAQLICCLEAGQHELARRVVQKALR